MKTQTNLLREVIQDIRTTDANAADFVSDIRAFIPNVVTNLYEPRLTAVLDQQMAKTNLFIRDRRVQSLISRQFNNNEFTMFDPSNGDNMCESRIFLLDIFRQNKSYAELSNDERLVISICHILRLYQIAVIDEFGLEVKSIERPSVISYQGDNKGSKISVSKCTANKSPYDTVSMISHALSLISARYVQKLASILDADLLQDLVIYNRDKNHQGKRLAFPSQVKSFPAAFTIFNSLKILDIPMIYRITRLEVERAEDNPEYEFKLQGVDFIAVRFVEDQLRCVDIDSIDPEAPQFIFSAKSVFSSVGIKNSSNSTLSKIAEIASIGRFEDFMSSLKERFDSGIEGMHDIVSAFAILDSICVDAKHRNGIYSSSVLNNMKALVGDSVAGFFANSASGKAAERSNQSVPLQFCHCYLNSIAKERNAIAELIALSPKSGTKIEKLFYKNMDGITVPFI